MYTAKGTIERSHLVEQYMPLVKRMAAHLARRLPAHIDIDDLIQAGTVGLLETCNRYEPSMGSGFEKLVAQRVRGAMLDEVRTGDWSPRQLRQDSRKVEAAIQAVMHRQGGHASESDIAREMGVSLADYQALLTDMRGCQLIYSDEFDDVDNENNFLDRESSLEQKDQAREADPMKQLQNRQYRQRLVAAIGGLPEREQMVLSLYYDDELTLREIGHLLEVTESRACQLHNQAVSRLRTVMLHKPGKSGA